MRLLLGLSCLFFSWGLIAQIPTQTLRGTVVDAVTTQPVIGAELRLTADSSVFLAVSDDYGKYVFTELPVGRYILNTYALGYEAAEVPGILIESAKPTVFRLELRTGTTELAGVTVAAPVAALQPVGTELITIEQVNRFPATFYDPARLAASYAGVANTSDQANGLSVRGNSPTTLQWRLEGVEIVNPNHTPNAGTFSDRTTLYGGGVNILSAQLLGNTQLHKGPFAARYGNAVGGVLDMELRRGNTESRARAAQISLVGIDLSAEGPLFKNSEASIVSNLRYSFTGILAELGADFGGEEIRFYDAATSAYLPVGNRGAYFDVIAVYGQSSNRFNGPAEDTIQEEKDLRRIDFEAQTSILGATFVQPVGTAAVLKSTFVYSGLGADRLVARTADAAVVEGETVDQHKLAFHTGWAQRLSSQSKLNAGVYVTGHLFDARYFGGPEDLVDALPDAALIEGYAEWTRRWTPQWRMQLGLSAQYYSYGANNKALEPRISVAYTPARAHRLTAAYGLHSQLNSPLLYLRPTGTLTADLEVLGFRRAHHATLAYEWFGPRDRRVTAAFFYQDHFDVPIGGSGSVPAFSAFNLTDGVGQTLLTNGGTGRNYGAELTFEQRLRADWYFLLNGTYFRSQFGRSDNATYSNGRFDGRYLVNATVGKEWPTKRAGRFLGLNGRLNYFGGYRAQPIDLEASRAAGRTVFGGSGLFTEAPDRYFRIDTRLYWKLNHPKRTTTLALDIQNVTATENLAFRYYDSFLDEIVERTQLGLIPNLTYRVEW